MTLLTLLQNTGGVIPPTPPPIVTNPMGGSGDTDDDGYYPGTVKRPDYSPQPEKIKQPYIEALKEVSKDAKPEIEKPRPKRKRFKEPEVIYKPRLKSKSLAEIRKEPSVEFDPTPWLPPLSESDKQILQQRAQALADRQREAQEAEQMRLAMESQRREQAVRQDDEDVVLATLLLIDKGVL